MFHMYVECYTATYTSDMTLNALVTGYAQEADPGEEEEAESELSGSDADVDRDDSESLLEHTHAKLDTNAQKQPAAAEIAQSVIRCKWYSFELQVMLVNHPLKVAMATRMKQACLSQMHQKHQGHLKMQISQQLVADMRLRATQVREDPMPKT